MLPHLIPSLHLSGGAGLPGGLAPFCRPHSRPSREGTGADARHSAHCPECRANTTTCDHTPQASLGDQPCRVPGKSRKSWSWLRPRSPCSQDGARLRVRGDACREPAGFSQPVLNTLLLEVSFLLMMDTGNFKATKNL